MVKKAVASLRKAKVDDHNVWWDLKMNNNFKLWDFKPHKISFYYDPFHICNGVTSIMEFHLRKKNHRHCAKQGMRVQIQSIVKKKWNLHGSHSFLCKIQNVWNKLHTHTSQWITLNFVMSEHCMEKLTFFVNF